MKTSHFRWILLSFFFLLAPVADSMDQPFRAGLAVRNVTPEVGVPLGGYTQRRHWPIKSGGEEQVDATPTKSYATHFKPSTGVLDPIRAKALVLSSGDKRLLFMSLDVVAVSGSVQKKIVEALKPLGFQEGAIFISATHTHSGPGTLAENFFWENLAMDKFKSDVFARYLAGVVETAREANAAVQPAELYATRFDVVGLQRNRRKEGAEVPREAQILLVKAADGSYLGALANWAIHGTALDYQNLHFSGDVPGAIERGLEHQLETLNRGLGRTPAPIPVLFVNGAEGDVAPVADGLTAMRFTGENFARQFLKALPSARKIPDGWSVRSVDVDLGKPYLNLGNCGKMIEFPFLDDVVAPDGIHVPLGKWIPRSARISQIRLGDQDFITWPGEPTTAVGNELLRQLKANGARNVWILSLTNEYLAYFPSTQEYSVESFESCFSLYGPEGGGKILRAHTELFKTRSQ